MERRGARDIEGKVTRIGAREPGGERVSIEKWRIEAESKAQPSTAVPKFFAHRSPLATASKL